MKCFLEDVTDQYDDYSEYWLAFLNTRDNEERRKARENNEKEKRLAEDLAWSCARTSKKRGRKLKEEIAKILCGHYISTERIAEMLDFTEKEVKAINANLDDKYKIKKEENKIMQIRFDDKNDSKDLIRGRLEGMLVEKINTLIRMKKGYHFYDCDGYWVTKLEYKRIDKICKDPLKELEMFMDRVLKEGIESVKGNTGKEKEETYEETIARIDREIDEKIYRKKKGIAKKMILEDKDIELISRISGLSEKEIEEIKNGTLI